MIKIAVPNAERGQAGKLARALDLDLVYSFSHSATAIVSGVVLVMLVGAALLAPWIAPQDAFNPASLDLMDGKMPPLTSAPITSNWYILGTDDQGRDVLSAILYGMRISIMVGAASVLLSALIGVALGLIAGYRGGVVDGLIMRVADVQLSFPSILIALTIFGVAGTYQSPETRQEAALAILILSIGLSAWPQYARTVRGVTMVEREREYVQAARIIGVHPALILTRHILPNATGPVLVIATLGFALSIISEATLSFLGVGVPPTNPSLGTLIRTGQEYIASGQWWILLYPSLALLMLALSVNLIGDWLRDALNPKLR